MIVFLLHTYPSLHEVHLQRVAWHTFQHHINHVWELAAEGIAGYSHAVLIEEFILEKRTCQDCIGWFVIIQLIEDSEEFILLFIELGKAQEIADVVDTDTLCTMLSRLFKKFINNLFLICRLAAISLILRVIVTVNNILRYLIRMRDDQVCQGIGIGRTRSCSRTESLAELSLLIYESESLGYMRILQIERHEPIVQMSKEISLVS